MADRRLLGELLVEAGLVRRGDLESALAEQRDRGGRLCYHLMRLGKVTPGSLFLFLQEHFGVLSPDLLDILRTGPVIDLIPPRLAHFYQMVPLRREANTLLLALAYVDNPNLIPAVEELTGLRVEPLICPPDLIREALERFFQADDEVGVIRNVTEENVLVLSDRDRGIAPAAPEALRDDVSPVHWLRALIAEAILRRCREVLLEPVEGEGRVTYRQREGGESSRLVPPGVMTGLGVALEDLAKMAARGRTVPREGRFRLRHGDRHLAALVTSLPGFHGDAYHLRIVEERIRKESLEEMLEDYPDAQGALEAALAPGKGLLLLAAPEGHYREKILAALVNSARWRAGRTIFLTVPGVPEIPGVEVRNLEGESAPTLPEMILLAARDRPDLLAAACVHTREDAAALLEAGADRLVVAGIRKADAFEAFEWLIRGGLLPEIRAGRLCGILGMRMVERICEHCRKRYDLLEEFPNLVANPDGGGLYFANTGCRACRGAGVLDLEPAFEFLPGAPAFAETVGGFTSPGKARLERARSGVKTLYASILARAAAGEVDVREPLRLLLNEGRGAA